MQALLSRSKLVELALFLREWLRVHNPLPTENFFLSALPCCLRDNVSRPVDPTR